MKMNYAFCSATRYKCMIHSLFPHNWAHGNTRKMGKRVCMYSHTKKDKKDVNILLMQETSNKHQPIVHKHIASSGAD